MDIICCPNCNELLPDQAKYCSQCGAIISSYKQAFINFEADDEMFIVDEPTLNITLGSKDTAAIPIIQKSWNPHKEASDPAHQVTWHKDVITTLERPTPTSTPRPSQPRPTIQKGWYGN